ncbi:MAG: hypothetical protein EXS37_19125 [Opitutus sp.]|nr:hypothetical protein [Opitutus sp.]
MSFVFAAMSITELQSTADRLTAEERAWLRAYLNTLEQIKNPEFLADIARRRRNMEAGLGVPREKVLAALGFGEAELRE